jgi:hypothetical protein
LAWEDIQDEQDDLRLDEGQKRQLTENVKKAQRDLKESIWRTYKNLVLLGKDNQLRVVDLGPVHSSQADTWIGFVLNRLRQDGEVEKDPSPNFVVRNWPPAFKEWSTTSGRDAFFASPQFPRLLDPEAVKGTIARGVEAGLLAYVSQTSRGEYDPFVYARTLNPIEVEVSVREPTSSGEKSRHGSRSGASGQGRSSSIPALVSTSLESQRDVRVQTGS